MNGYCVTACRDPDYFLPFGLRFLAVFAAFLKSFADGAPLLPGLFIFSPLPALMRRFLAAMFA